MLLNKLRQISAGLALTVGSIAACASDEAPNDDTTCTPGTEGCACYPNGSCNVPLTCSASARCEAQSGQGGASGNAGSSNGGGDTGGMSTGGTNATGGSDAGSGNTSTGGLSSGGSGTGGDGGSGSGTGGNAGGGGAGVGGAAGGGMAGSSSGGAGAGSGGMTGGTTGASAGDGGSAGSGGSAGNGGSAATCGNTTSDWQNCGACGRACRNPGDQCTTRECCVDGQCAPSWGECIVAGDGFATCEEYCTSIGESCVAVGCGNSHTYLGWAISVSDRCEAAVQQNGSSDGACDSAISFQIATSAIVRCCCTDTP